jgi:hypothetical protein
MYEVNNTANTAYPLNVNFSGNTASVATPGSNMHVGNDYDYYKINLPSGENYTITARVHDSYNSGNGQNYSNDVQFSYIVNGNTSSESYDDVMPGNINVPNGGTVVFFVSPYFTGSTGTYLLDLKISKTGTSGIADAEQMPLMVFPNPARNEFYIDASDMESNYELQIYNAAGAAVKNESGKIRLNEIMKINISDLAAGIYSVHLKTNKGIGISKLSVK